MKKNQRVLKLSYSPMAGPRIEKTRDLEKGQTCSKLARVGNLDIKGWAGISTPMILLKISRLKYQPHLKLYNIYMSRRNQISHTAAETSVGLKKSYVPWSFTTMFFF